MKYSYLLFGRLPFHATHPKEILTLLRQLLTQPIDIFLTWGQV